MKTRSALPVATLLFVCLSIGAVAQPLTITTLAGQTGGAVDGPGDVALLHSPMDIAADADGNLYVTDYQNSTIRKISPTGLVTTLAGLGYASGSQNGTGVEARFGSLHGIAIDSGGNLYVADSNSSTIRKVTQSGVVTTLAGLAGSQGSIDGTGTDARFFIPKGLAIDHYGNVYVSQGNHIIRKITADGVVTTIAGLAGVSGNADGNGSEARFSWLDGIEIDADGNLYVADTGNDSIRKITPAGVVTTFVTSIDARGLAFDASGNLYASGYRIIYKITPAGDVTTFATGFGEGRGFVVIDDVIYIPDSSMIRRVTPDGTVTTLAGRPGGAGFTDATGRDARFYWPYGIAADVNGNLFIADRINQNIRKITPAGEVTTFAGPTSGYTSIFNHPRGVAVDDDGFVFVADTDNHTIRKISPAGVVETFAGMQGIAGSSDGTGALFNMPAGLAYRDGILYVADMNNHTIRTITASGEVSTFAGLAQNSGSADGTGSMARFNQPEGVAVDASGNVYVADTHNHTIRKITPDREVTTFAGLAQWSGPRTDGTGSAARFNQPKGIAFDTAGNLYIGDTGYFAVRKITPDGVVTTVAGGTRGTADGTGSAARFSSLAGVAVGSEGRVYIADMANYSIRVGTPALADTATIDAIDGPLFVPRQLDTAPQTATEWNWSVIRRPAGSSNDFSSASIRNPTFVPDAGGLFTFQLVATNAPFSSITTVDLTVPVPVVPDSPANFFATARSSTSIHLQWTPVSGATQYDIFRSSVGGEFVLLDSTPNVTFTDATASPDSAYLYKVRAVVDNVPSSFSAVDFATTIVINNEQLIGTRATADHLLDLRVAVNAMRAAGGLGPGSFPTNVAPGSPIRASAIYELRFAADSGRAALGLSPIGYAEPTLTHLRAYHVTQLRLAVE